MSVKRPARKKKTRIGTADKVFVSVFAATAVVGAIALAVFLRSVIGNQDKVGLFEVHDSNYVAIRDSGAPDKNGSPEGASPADVNADDQGKTPEAADKNATEDQKKTKGVLIFVIDDVGYNVKQLVPFLDFPGPITLAVLPGCPYTRKAAEMIVAAGKELILHLPMEALGDLDEGPGAVYRWMAPDTIAKIVEEDLDFLPGVKGINNHMGSLATSDEKTVRAVLEVARSRGLYFLDSLTIGSSVVHQVANNIGLRAWERDVFLDNVQDKQTIIGYINEGKKLAEKHGYAIMIGHVWSAELAQTLMDLYPELIEEGFTLSTISQIMLGDDDENIRH